ncbi:MAG: radical SAM family RiPP maturation amino acid epimerase [Solobacterium sp.]|nr:radical SAM family RiPP maturation amino acid epimerase [Solobacterium sp.]
MGRFAKKEDEYIIGWIKRFMEYETMIPGFHEEEVSDPEAALKKYGFPLTAKDVSFYPNLDNIREMRPVYPESGASKYAAFMSAKLGYRDELKKICVPTHPAMRKWHKRQAGRCMAVLGARTDALIHLPFTIELSDGCSVGCEFCGLAAGKLKSVFRHTEENGRLFRKSLWKIRELIGPAVEQATMYFASEPLDNPDYELFLRDFEEIYEDNIPQITTAASMRHAGRLHKLLKEINEEGNTIYRFSVLSQKMAEDIFREFSPEELVYTELLPQFDAAPGKSFANVGRRAEKEGVYDNTISCVSGFIVNFANRTVRLTTPTPADHEHPTGQIILDRMEFTDDESLIECIKEMIKKHMMNIISPKDRVRLRQGLSVKISENGVITVTNGKGSEFTIDPQGKDTFYDKMFALFQSGYLTKREIVSELTKDYTEPVMTDTFHYCINRMWELGLLELESGKI